MRAKTHRRGGRRENAGRPSLAPGKTIKRTFRFTPEASAAIDAHAALLSVREGKAVTASDAVDSLVQLGAVVAVVAHAETVNIRGRKGGKVR